jgi:hypothetical protein
MRPLRVAAVALLAVAATGCLAPATRSQRLLEAARETNVSARFGRMDVAAMAVAADARAGFLRRRASWGDQIRVVDVELAGLDVDRKTSEATVDVQVAWVRMSEGVLRATRVQQKWREDKRGWKLASEERTAGDLGLFGEPVEVLRPEREAVQFATRRLSPVIEGDRADSSANGERTASEPADTEVSP